MILIFSVLAIYILVHPDIEHSAKDKIIIFLIIKLAITLPLLLVSIQWSFLLKNVINNNQQSNTSNSQGQSENNQQFMAGPNQYIGQ